MAENELREPVRKWIEEEELRQTIGKWITGGEVNLEQSKEMLNKMLGENQLKMTNELDNEER